MDKGYRPLKTADYFFNSIHLFFIIYSDIINYILT